MLSFSTVPSFFSITIALRSCIALSSSFKSSSVTVTCGSFTVTPVKFFTSTLGNTSYFTVYVRSFVMSISGIFSITGCEYGRGRFSVSSLKISSKELSISSPIASALIESPYFLSNTFAGTCPFLNPGICAFLMYLLSVDL